MLEVQKRMSAEHAVADPVATHTCRLPIQLRASRLLVLAVHN